MVRLSGLSRLALLAALMCAVGVQAQSTPFTPFPSNAPSKAPSSAPSRDPSDAPSSAPSMHLAESTILNSAMIAFTVNFSELAIVPALDVKIPLIGLSTTEILGKDGIFTALNFSDFVPKMIPNNVIALVGSPLTLLCRSLYFRHLSLPHLASSLLVDE
jgi:hypothetical protein